jgi:hypothetical protein
LIFFQKIKPYNAGVLAAAGGYHRQQQRAVEVVI